MHPFLLLGFICISGSQPDVKCTTSDRAVLGGTVTLTCALTLLHLDIEQLTWQKHKDNVPQNIATQSKKYGVKMNPSFNQRVSVNGTELNRSSITISDLRREDETLYICIFNAFPFGAFKGTVYLTVSDTALTETADEQRPKEEEEDTAGGHSDSGTVEFHERLRIIIVLPATVAMLCIMLLLYLCLLNPRKNQISQGIMKLEMCHIEK